MCKMIAENNPEYSVSMGDVIVYITSAKDQLLRRLVGREQNMTYTLCNRHHRVLNKLISEYVSNYNVSSP